MPLTRKMGITERLKLRAAAARLWWRDEDGGPTVEFALLFTPFVLLLVASFELGLFMTRQVMLERATDITVRALRLGQFNDPNTGDPPNQTVFRQLLRQNICNNAMIIKNCDSKVLIEMTTIPTDTWTTFPDPTKCVNRDQDLDPVITFNGGTPNDLMLIRVCALVRPMFPTTYFGLRLPNFDDRYRALVATSAFVNEPGST